MKKLLITLALLLAIQPITASASLWNYYNEIGQKLPSLSERSNIYTEISNDKYVGSISQNNALENYLRGFGAVTPQPRLLGDNTWTGTNNFSGTTTIQGVSSLATTTTTFLSFSSTDVVFSTSSGVYSTTTSYGGNWDTTFNCGFAPNIIEVRFYLNGVTQSVNRTYNGVAIFDKLGTIKSTQYFSRIDGGTVTAGQVVAGNPEAGGIQDVGYYYIVLSVLSVSGNNVTVRLAATDNSGASLRQNFSITCYR